MGRRITFTEAQVRRAVKAAREIDPQSIIEVTRDGKIRILPAEKKQGGQSEVDRWFDGQG